MLWPRLKAVVKKIVVEAALHVDVDAADVIDDLFERADAEPGVGVAASEGQVQAVVPSQDRSQGKDLSRSQVISQAQVLAQVQALENADAVSRADAAAAVAAILITAALSRTAGLMPLVFLPPARRDGLSHAVGQPARDAFWLAAGIAGAIAVVVGAFAGLPPLGIALTIVLSGLAGLALTGFAARHLGGQTGDIVGAAQQVAEIAALIGLLTVLAP